MKNILINIPIIALILFCGGNINAQTNTEDCSSFRPEPGEEYIISAWVKEDLAEQVMTYANGQLKISFVGAGEEYDLYPKGEIIDGWQRILDFIRIPGNATDINIELVNGSSNIIYYDDIRVHPYHSNLKSFVYDPENLRLMAELDENNYATYYEYDKEGGLVRVKKETEKGVYTLQETRSGNSNLSN